MEYRFTRQAFRQFRKLDPAVQRRIIKKLDFFCGQQKPLDFAEPLLGEELGQYRFRIGDWRVIFDVNRKGILILLVGHRREIYR